MSALLLSVIFLTGMNGTGWGEDERRSLLKQQSALTKRINDLKREQEYLLFLKTLSSADSKYLIFNLSKRTGQLKYKNRILKDFSFSLGSARSRPAQGAATLTGKKELTTGRKEMIFGKSFILQRKEYKIRGDMSAPRFFIAKKDFTAIFYALEEGSRAYVIP